MPSGRSFPSGLSGHHRGVRVSGWQAGGLLRRCLRVAWAGPRTALPPGAASRPPRAPPWWCSRLEGRGALSRVVAGPACLSVLQDCLSARVQRPVARWRGEGLLHPLPLPVCCVALRLGGGGLCTWPSIAVVSWGPLCLRGQARPASVALDIGGGLPHRHQGRTRQARWACCLASPRCSCPLVALLTISPLGALCRGVCHCGPALLRPGVSWRRGSHWLLRGGRGVVRVLGVFRTPRVVPP